MLSTETSSFPLMKNQIANMGRVEPCLKPAGVYPSSSSTQNHFRRAWDQGDYKAKITICAIVCQSLFPVASSSDHPESYFENFMLHAAIPKIISRISEASNVPRSGSLVRDYLAFVRQKFFDLMIDQVLLQQRRNPQISRARTQPG